jgi:hypothetical protein
MKHFHQGDPKHPVVMTVDFPGVVDLIGEIPAFLDLNDPRPAREQFDANYQHGGGWRPQSGFTRTDAFVLHYPGDPPFLPIAMMALRRETILIYLHAYVAIFQADGSFEVCRMD